MIFFFDIRYEFVRMVAKAAQDIAPYIQIIERMFKYID